MNSIVRLAMGTALICAFALAGCGMRKKDMDYRAARELSALRVPADLDRPQETRLMKIPEVKPNVLFPQREGVESDQGAPVTSDDLERPPNILSGR